MVMSGAAPEVSCSWLPLEPTRTWDAAAAIAVPAIVSEARARGGRPSVVSVQQDALRDGPALIQQLFRTGEYGTLKGRWPQAGPVLAWVPDVRVVQRAWRTAHGSALVVVEYFPDAGQTPGLWAAWAAQLRAVDLTTGQVTPDERSDQLREDIAHVLWTGNNGWPQKDPIVKGAVSYLRGVHERDELDEAAFVAAAVIAGKSPDAIGRLQQMVAAARRHVSSSPPPTASRW
jgi:hypothetical protein